MQCSHESFYPNQLQLFATQPLQTVITVLHGNHTTNPHLVIVIFSTNRTFEHARDSANRFVGATSFTMLALQYEHKRVELEWWYGQRSVESSLQHTTANNWNIMRKSKQAFVSIFAVHVTDTNVVPNSKNRYTGYLVSSPQIQTNT